MKYIVYVKHILYKHNQMHSYHVRITTTMYTSDNKNQR